MGQCTQALFYQTKAIAFRENALPVNLSELVVSYNDIDTTYYKFQHYSKAKL